MKLILENKDGKTVRTFLVEGDTAFVINRTKTRRLEIHTSVTALEASKEKFDHLGEISHENLKMSSFSLGNFGELKLVEFVETCIVNHAHEKETSKAWYGSLILMILLMGSFLTFLFLRPVETVKLEQEMRQQLVQIVKRIPPKPKVIQEVTQDMKTEKTAEPVKPVKTTKTLNVKRFGALAALGQLKNSKQNSGLNLGAVNTTAGPGLGGNAGSGGIQKSLYGKGLVAAPLGAGSNMNGGGGYGTKGKGGGQAGYGSMSLVGSAGAASIPLGREALIEGGLDRDLISDVINRNMGQVRFCYEQGLQGNPGLAGRIAVAFTIGGNGQVKLANVENTTLNSQTVEECIVMRLKTWKFPLPQGGVDVKVSFPFVLRRSGQS
jgi:hypothetical protein